MASQNSATIATMIDETTANEAKAVLRASRTAAAATLQEAADAAGARRPSMHRLMQASAPRGRCDGLARDAALSSGESLNDILGHRLCAPSLRRAAEAASPGVAGWPARTLGQTPVRAAVVSAAVDPNPEQRARAASEKTAALALLGALASDDEPGVRKASAHNTATCKAALAGCISTDPTHAHSGMFSIPHNEIVRYLAWKNPSTPPWAIAASRYRASSSIDSFLAMDAQCPQPVLASLVGHPDDDVRRQLAGNPACSEQMLDDLASDEDWTVRYNIARHDATSVHVLELLALDEHDDVALKAAENLGLCV